MQKLTARQEKAFQFICKHTASNGFAPSLRELCEHMGYKAVGSAQDVISSLRRKGYLKIPEQQKARSLAVTAQAKRLMATTVKTVDDAFKVPKLGSVPAGHPLEAIEDDGLDTLQVSISTLPKPLPKPDQLFALQASGLSMIGAGILDGDWLIVRKQNIVSYGKIVVAMVDGAATVKTLAKDENGNWYLKAENPDFAPIKPKDQSFEIVGQVIALQRSMT